jgi:hypothetical protein
MKVFARFGLLLLPAAAAFALRVGGGPAIADVAPSPAPTPTDSVQINIDEKVADNQSVIDESGADAQAALKLGNDADDAAKAAQSVNTESLDIMKSGLTASGQAMHEIENASPALISIDDAPRQQLWTIVRRDTAAAQAAAAKLGQSKSDPNESQCEKLHDQVEQLDLSADAIDAAAATPADVLEYVKSVAAKAGPDASATLEASFERDISPDVYAMGQTVADASAAKQLILAEAYYVADQEKKANCGEFAGQFTSAMNVTFLTKEKTEWWKYEIDLKGTIHLRYAYADPSTKNAPQKVTGEIMGAATKFSVWTDPFNTPEGQKFIGGSIIEKTETPPDAQSELALASEGALMGEPATFVIPISGDLTGNVLHLTLGDAQKDFDPDTIQSETKLTIASPYTNYLPVKTSYKLPYKDARFILQHFFRTPLTIASSNGTQDVWVGGYADRPADRSNADYSMDGTICDPGCI